MKRLLNRKLRKVENGIEKLVEVRFMPSQISNFQFIVTDDEHHFAVGVLENEKSYLLGDRVLIAPDIMGYITPGIEHPGEGMITRICTDDIDHFYGVQMDNGEFGFVKSARIKSILTA